MHDLIRFRIKSECLAEALFGFRKTGVEPSAVVHREDGEVAVEFRNLSDADASAVAAALRPEHSTIMGFVGGNPFETRH